MQLSHLLVAIGVVGSALTISIIMAVKQHQTNKQPVRTWKDRVYGSYQPTKRN